MSEETMFPYWIETIGERHGVCYGPTPERAIQKAREVLGIALHVHMTAKLLPYNSRPTIWEPNDEVVRPNFCYRPEECARFGRCMGFRSCVE